jgi:hypothetical protein
MPPSACVPAVTRPPKKLTPSMFGRWREKPKIIELPIEIVRWPLSTPPGEEQRCALLLYGLPKFFRELSYPTLHERVISRLPFPCDVYVHTYDLRETSNTRNGEVDCKLDPEEVLAAKPLQSVMQSQDSVDKAHHGYFQEMKRHGDAWFNHFVSLRNVLRQYNSLKQVCAPRTRERSARILACASSPSFALPSSHSAVGRAANSRAARALRARTGCRAPGSGVRSDGGGAGGAGHPLQRCLLLAGGCALPGRLGT